MDSIRTVHGTVLDPDNGERRVVTPLMQPKKDGRYPFKWVRGPHVLEAWLKRRGRR